MRGLVKLLLQVNFLVLSTIEVYANEGPPIPPDLQECAFGSNHELHFDTKIKGVSDSLMTGPISCIYQYSDIWHVMDCETGRVLVVVMFRSEPTEWSTEPAVAEVTEAAMTYRETLARTQTPVSFDAIRDDMRELGAEVSERNFANYRASCASG